MFTKESPSGNVHNYFRVRVAPSCGIVRLVLNVLTEAVTVIVVRSCGNTRYVYKGVF